MLTISSFSPSTRRLPKNATLFSGSAMATMATIPAGSPCHAARVLPSSSGGGAAPTLPWPWWTSSSNDHGGRPYPVHRQITMKATRGRRKREVEGGIRGAKVILHALSTLDGGPSLHVSESGNCVASNTRGWQKYRSHSKSPISRSVKSKSGI